MPKLSKRLHKPLKIIAVLLLGGVFYLIFGTFYGLHTFRHNLQENSHIAGFFAHKDVLTDRIHYKIPQHTDLQVSSLYFQSMMLPQQANKQVIVGSRQWILIPNKQASGAYQQQGLMLLTVNAYHNDAGTLTPKTRLNFVDNIRDQLIKPYHCQKNHLNVIAETKKQITYQVTSTECVAPAKILLSGKIWFEDTSAYSLAVTKGVKQKNQTFIDFPLIQNIVDNTTMG